MLIHHVRMVHGIRTMDGGKKTFKKLKLLLSNLLDNSEIDLVDYGYVLIPISNNKAANAVIKSLEDIPSKCPTTIVAYSNGCWASVQAAERGFHVDHLILINPALNKKHEFPGDILRVDVYYSPTDNVTRLGKWYSKIVNILPWRWTEKHDWGEMGKTGYIGNDPRVHNHNMGDVSHFFYDHHEVSARISQDIDRLYEEDMV